MPLLLCSQLPASLDAPGPFDNAPASFDNVPASSDNASAKFDNASAKFDTPAAKVVWTRRRERLRAAGWAQPV